MVLSCLCLIVCLIKSYPLPYLILALVLSIILADTRMVRAMAQKSQNLYLSNGNHAAFDLVLGPRERPHECAAWDVGTCDLRMGPTFTSTKRADFHIRCVGQVVIASILSAQRCNAARISSAYLARL